MSYNLFRFSTPGPHKGTYGAASQQDDYHLPKVIEIQPQNHQTRHPKCSEATTDGNCELEGRT